MRRSTARIPSLLLLASGLVALGVLPVACGGGGSEGEGESRDGGEELQFADARERASYGVGYQFASRVDQGGAEVSLEHLLDGVRDGIRGDEPRLSEEEINAALQELQQQIAEEQRRLGEENVRQGEEFLAEVRQRPAVQTLPSGVMYEVIEEGDGPSPEADARVTVHYEGRKVDGTVFDSSLERGEPETFPANATIPGLSEAIQRMQVGDEWKVYIPPEQGYGERAPGEIGPHATLVYEVQLLGIEGTGDGASE